MIWFGHVNLKKRRPQTFTPKHTPMSNLVFCQAFTTQLVPSSMYWPLSDHRYQPKGLLQLLKPFTCSPDNATGQRARKKIILEILPDNDRWAWQENTPAALSQESLAEQFALHGFKSSPSTPRSNGPRSYWPDNVFFINLPPFLLWPLSN